MALNLFTFSILLALARLFMTSFIHHVMNNLRSGQSHDVKTRHRTHEYSRARFSSILATTLNLASQTGCGSSSLDIDYLKKAMDGCC